MRIESGFGSEYSCTPQRSETHALHSVLPRARPSATLCQPRRQCSFYQRATQLLRRGGTAFSNTSSGRVLCRRCTAPHTAQPTLSDTNQPPEQRDNPLQRIVSGLLLAILGSLSIYAGGVLFTGKPYRAYDGEAVPVIHGLSLGVLSAGLVCLCSYQVCQEFYGFVISKGVAEGSQPPPQGVTVFISLLCTSLALFTYLSKGRSTAALAVATFAVLSLQLITSERIGISELGLTALGLVYCGYLPSYWVNLRLLAIPSTATVTAGLPAALGASTRWTVGLVATLMSVACIVAADVGAYFFGKTVGRTRLHSVSPKKTVEGAVGGLFCSSATALLFWRLFAWPSSPFMAVGMGVLIFCGSLCGDLIESAMKRDAGLKDAGNLIPGHGGLLDRMDSFLWCGALVYFLLKFVAYGI